ncbi:Polyadenylate-binding protein-interacting protein 7 [Camellia lanceoleosa]|uniref:Polyadenylate-binding protein-interacting protein 7 n=1 Tax=Camellia lanceoleosa TaxID=1840588 RepID=A0ACC0FHC0_9ERIC|nr:Polyadenylate-binding protein-interacting protein 7 [Camellia lanceoleosa]
MSLSNKGAPTNDKKLSTPGKVTSLNPNAAEFVPFALRSSSGSTSTADVSTGLGVSVSGTLGKAVLDRSESSISNNSDEEAHQYWRHQLPDDITPDFKVMGEYESQGINNIPFSTLSLQDGNETLRFSTSMGGGFMLKEQHELSSHGINGNSFENMRYSVPSYSEDASSANFLHFPNKPWDKPIVSNDQLISNVGEGPLYNDNSRHGMLNEQEMAENMEINPLEFLASQFPGFAAESLAEVYFANGGDLNLTIEMLTQLELQVDGGLNQNLNSKALSAPNLSALDFPALSVHDGQNGLPKYAGDDIQQSGSPYRSSSKDSMLLFKSSSSIPTRGATDFASAVRKMSSQDSGIWKYERNGSADASVGSSRSAHLLASSYSSGQGRSIYGDRLQSRSSSRTAPVWLETGEAVANMYSEMREEARDHARLRNAYFEQARQAYLIGNKALAKELSVKGQLHNMRMKAAHGKAQESIYRQRNPVSPEMQGNGRGQERIIDLHGLHVSEAIHVLKRELSQLRSTARTAEQRLQVYICVGTGHHTRGSRTPARLPVAIQRYLLEQEGLDYSELQPGLLQVMIY